MRCPSYGKAGKLLKLPLSGKPCASLTHSIAQMCHCRDIQQMLRTATATLHQALSKHLVSA